VRVFRSRNGNPGNRYNDLANPLDERTGMTGENRKKAFQNQQDLLRQADKAEQEGDMRTAQRIRRNIGD
jgi:hypothetical protein